MLGDVVLDQLFRAARSTHAFTSQPVTDELLAAALRLAEVGTDCLERAARPLRVCAICGSEGASGAGSVEQ